MNNTFNQIMMTAVTLVILSAGIYFIRLQITRFTRGNRLRVPRGKLSNKIIIGFLLGIVSVVFIFIWGINTSIPITSSSRGSSPAPLPGRSVARTMCHKQPYGIERIQYANAEE